LARRALQTIPKTKPYFQNEWNVVDFFTLFVQACTLRLNPAPTVEPLFLLSVSQIEERCYSIIERGKRFLLLWLLSSRCPSYPFAYFQFVALASNASEQSYTREVFFCNLQFVALVSNASEQSYTQSYSMPMMMMSFIVLSETKIWLYLQCILCVLTVHTMCIYEI